ncbi:ABC transporter permease [Saccharothrix syringae]|uniref:Transport permease protein n=1 Tax=Saccharothrix syringae TaxID=103733 RepID=A0A5Q0H5L0_SACSY|nr:ABC transporter permease [Saccharothrix syringae]QFZ21224.1 ABC transporter permease [Saccharothrix syringae]
MKVLRDTWLIFRHETEVMARNPGLIALTLAQPIAYLVFFAPFLKAAMATRGVDDYGDAYAVYVPGLFVAMGLFGGLYAGYGLLSSLRAGVIDRCRVTPVSRTGLVLGRALMHVALLEFQATVITLAALPLGLRVSPLDLAVSYALLSLVILLSISVSYGIAMLVRNENSLGTLINTVGQPVSLLAGAVIPLALAPLWVQDVSRWNPFAWATDGLRALFTGGFTDPAVWQGALVMVAACAVSVGWSVRLFNREVS